MVCRREGQGIAQRQIVESRRPAACTRQTRDGIPDLSCHPIDLDDLFVGLYQLGELLLRNTDLLKKLSNCGRVVDNEPSAVDTAREVYLGAGPAGRQSQRR